CPARLERATYASLRVNPSRALVLVGNCRGGACQLSDNNYFGCVPILTSPISPSSSNRIPIASLHVTPLSITGIATRIEFRSLPEKSKTSYSKGSDLPSIGEVRRSQLQPSSPT